MIDNSIIAAELNLEHFGVKRSSLSKVAERGNSDNTAIAFIEYLKSRNEPHVGYGRNYLYELRESCSAEDLKSARQKIVEASERNILLPLHSNAFAALGAETLLIGLDADLCHLLAQCVAAHQPNWEKGSWGVTHGIMAVVRVLLVLPESCPDDIAPWLAWLVTRVRAEWQNAATWSELMLGTSGHNWWAHTFSGFFQYGLILSEFKSAAKYRAFGHDYLDREVSLLFESDGWTKEGSPSYHEFAIGNLFEMVHLAELNGMIISPATREKLPKLAHAGLSLIAPDCDYPLFGDFVRYGQNWTGALLRRRAARFGFPDMKYVAEALDPDFVPPFQNILPDEGKNVLSAYHRLALEKPQSSDTALKKSGFYAIRNGWTPTSDYMCLVAGSVGSRVTSHKHADIFSFELYAKGRRILVDNGYGPAAGERDSESVRMYRVSSKAHNTTTVDGEDQVEVVREFMFGSTVIPTVDEWRTERDFAYFSGVHEGYLRLKEPIAAVRRKVFYLRNKYWIVIDRFTSGSSAEHDYELHFHLAVPGKLHAGGRFITEGQGGNLMIVPVPDAAGKPTLQDNPYPVKGYENPRHLSYLRRTKHHDMFVTLLVPFEGDNTPGIDVKLAGVQCDGRELNPWEGTGLTIRIDGETHFYFDQHMTWNLPWQSGEYSGMGRLYHSQCMT